MWVVLSTAGYSRNQIAAGSVACRDHSPPGPRDAPCTCILANPSGEMVPALAVDSMHSESSLEPLLLTLIFRLIVLPCVQKKTASIVFGHK